MSDVVLTQQRDTLFEITLNRPDKRNAINWEVLAALDAAVALANRTPNIRAVLVSGAGPVFSAGVDLSLLAGLDEHYGAEWRQRSRFITADIQALLTRLERLEVPTICLLHGHCVGLGLELALACDLRLAAEGTQLGFLEARLGLIPDVGGSTRAARLVGPARAKEMIFTGRLMDAAVAERWGLVNGVAPASDLRAAGEALAAEIAQTAPLAAGMAKRVIDGMADLDRGLQLEAWAQSLLFNSEDFAEGLDSRMRRPPQFKGR